MKTIVTDSPDEAASYIRSGDTVAFPTETVYGLGADAFNSEAVRKIFDAKGRPSDNPLIVHFSSSDEIEGLVRALTAESRRLMEHFFPGPLTIVLEKSSKLPPVVTAGLDTVGIRMPNHPVASTFLMACGRPVAAPSANRSGRPSPTSWEAVQEDLGGRISCILRGGRSPVGLESTVVDCTTSPPAILRAGAVSAEQLEAVIPGIAHSFKDRGEQPRSPGIRHRHYAPRARVEIVDGPPIEARSEDAFIGLTPPRAELGLFLTCTSTDEYAYELFGFFRRCDAEGIRTILCERVREVGIGLAVMDRLRRASEVSHR